MAGMNADTEFGEEVVELTPEEQAAAAAKATASAREIAREGELAGLKAKVAEQGTKLTEFESIRNDAKIIQQLKELFAGGKGDDPKDALVRKEIRRLVPELDDIDKLKELLPGIVETLHLTAEERVEEKAQTATEVMKGLMGDLGLDSKDAEAVGYLEEALAREIKSNKEALGLWARGNVKSAVNKAFEKVQAKLFAPVRARAKVGAVRTITESPRATPRGGAPTAGSTAGKPKLDFKDSSRASIGKIHDAAFDRLQELVNE